IKCQLVSTRCRGTPALAPILEKPPTEISGNPPLKELVPVSNPIEVGLKLLSCGKNPSAKRFHPKRASLTSAELTIFTHDRATNCTRVGVTVLNPGSTPPANCAKGKLWSLLP